MSAANVTVRKEIRDALYAYKQVLPADEMRKLAAHLDQTLPPFAPAQTGKLSDNPLTAELLDLITLMPDSQTQEILDYIQELRAIRKLRDET